MNVSIGSIKILERIRKEVQKIDELAENIAQHGLLHALIVMELGDGEYRLLAGLRRLKAVQSLGWGEVDVNIVAPADAEEALRIEISENEQREPFSFTEKMDFARLIEEIERKKAELRKGDGQTLGGKTAGKGRPLDDSLRFPGTASYKKPNNVRARDVVGEKIGMSGTQYERAKFIAANAPPEVIDELDREERKIRPTYDELRKSMKGSEEEPEPTAPINPEYNINAFQLEFRANTQSYVAGVERFITGHYSHLWQSEENKKIAVAVLDEIILAIEKMKGLV